MEVASGLWADLALLLRRTDREADGFLPLGLFGLLLFLCVCLLLLQLIAYLSWKLTQGTQRPLASDYMSAKCSHVCQRAEKTGALVSECRQPTSCCQSLMFTFSFDRKLTAHVHQKVEETSRATS